MGLGVGVGVGVGGGGRGWGQTFFGVNLQTYQNTDLIQKYQLVREFTDRHYFVNKWGVGGGGWGVPTPAPIPFCYATDIYWSMKRKLHKIQNA